MCDVCVKIAAAKTYDELTAFVFADYDRRQWEQSEAVRFATLDGLRRRVAAEQERDRVQERRLRHSRGLDSLDSGDLG